MTYSFSFGELQETEYYIDWLESKPIEIPYINNEKLSITLVEKISEFILNGWATTKKVSHSH